MEGHLTIPHKIEEVIGTCKIFPVYNQLEYGALINATIFYFDTIDFKNNASSSKLQQTYSIEVL